MTKFCCSSANVEIITISKPFALLSLPTGRSQIAVQQSRTPTGVKFSSVSPAAAAKAHINQNSAGKVYKPAKESKDYGWLYDFARQKQTDEGVDRDSIRSVPPMILTESTVPSEAAPHSRELSHSKRSSHSQSSHKTGGDSKSRGARAEVLKLWTCVRVHQRVWFFLSIY